VQQAARFRLPALEERHARARVSVSRSIFALVDDRDRAYFGGSGDGNDQIGFIDANSARSSAAATPPSRMPDRKLRKDEAIAKPTHCC